MGSASNGHGPWRERRKVHLVGIHSFRGGSGKTMLAANLAFLAARRGARVAVLDADMQAPALHLVLGVDAKRILHSVSEFVLGRCAIEEVPIDLSHELGLDGQGKLHLLPSSSDMQTITSVLFEGYDVPRLTEHLLRLAEALEVDYLILDTHLGVNRETLLSLAISDTVLVLLRPDGQDHQGAAVLVEIAKKLDVPSCLLVPNMFSERVDAAQVAAGLEEQLGAPVAGVLPWCAELWERTCPGLFAARDEDHPLTAELERVSRQLLPTETNPEAA
jgi:MinD-like ATPase involved in chromosome partitioning or flagellar assembly